MEPLNMAINILALIAGSSTLIFLFNSLFMIALISFILLISLESFKELVLVKQKS